MIKMEKISWNWRISWKFAYGISVEAEESAFSHILFHSIQSIFLFFVQKSLLRSTMSSNFRRKSKKFDRIEKGKTWKWKIFVLSFYALMSYSKISLSMHQFSCQILLRRSKAISMNRGNEWISVKLGISWWNTEVETMVWQNFLAEKRVPCLIFINK